VPVGDVEELAAHLRLLVENPDMRRAFGISAREHVVKCFSWDAHLEKLMHVYQSL
jgi:glycosyltransferase involved in cell wall biosynthesis